jgi:selT/selW/selH-like putative selenoprotein
VKLAIHNEPGLKDLAVTGSNYPLTTVRQIATALINVGQFSFIALVAVGDRYLFPALRMRPPPWYNSLVENRMASILAAFFVGNMFKNGMSQTGAFEVYYQGKLVWSKLQSGQPPNIGYIMKAIRRAAGRV